jgi:putative sterol carrier protein
MAETREFFDDYMPKKLIEKPNLVNEVKAIFRFDVKDAGSWIIDLKSPPGGVRAAEEGEAADCVITVGKADWEQVLDKPSYAMQLFMTGKLKASNIGLAMALQKILG